MANTSFREINAGFGDSRLAAELIAIAAAAGAAALVIKHESGPTPFLKTKKSIVVATLGAAILAAIGLTKSMQDNSKKGTTASIFGIFAGVAAITGLFLATRLNKNERYLTSGGPDVFKAQYGLLKLGYHVTPNGALDDATKAALKSFQATYSLITTDGSLSPETAAYIDQAAAQMHAPAFTPDTGFHPPLTTQT